MLAIGAFEAKTHLSKLLNRVKQGEEILITRHGIPVARLIPVLPSNKEKIQKAFSQIDQLRKKTSPLRKKGETWRELAHEEHSW